MCVQVPDDSANLADLSKAVGTLVFDVKAWKHIDLSSVHRPQVSLEFQNKVFDTTLACVCQLGNILRCVSRFSSL